MALIQINRLSHLRHEVVERVYGNDPGNDAALVA
jgi:hypothetical protein